MVVGNCKRTAKERYHLHFLAISKNTSCPAPPLSCTLALSSSEANETRIQTAPGLAAPRWNDARSTGGFFRFGRHRTTQHNTPPHPTTLHNTTHHGTTRHNIYFGAARITLSRHYTSPHNTAQHDTTRHVTSRHDIFTKDATCESPQRI